MTSIYKELEVIIADFVGYKDLGEEFDEDGNKFNNYDCADPVLYDNLVDECSMHVRGEVPFNKLSDDARFCIDEWTSLIKHYSEYHSERI